VIAPVAVARRGGEVLPTSDLDALIAASAAALRLPLEAAWLPTIRLNLAATLRIAALVDEFPLPDDTEPAAVFRA
jgi:hypothetical protein